MRSGWFDILGLSYRQHLRTFLVQAFIALFLRQPYMSIVREDNTALHNGGQEPT
jgi:hypothetical protein